MKHFKFVMSSLQENRKIKARTALQPFINGRYMPIFTLISFKIIGKL